MSKGVSVVIFEGSRPKSEVEEMMTRVRHAALLDNLDKMNRISYIEDVYLQTNQFELAKLAEQFGAAVQLNNISPERFHFGRELQGVVKKYNLKRVLCLNGAGCPLISDLEIEQICHKLMKRDNLVYANNTQSVDILAFNVPEDFHNVELPATDNSLAMTLRDKLGLEMELMPHSLGLLFDIDTPSDVLILGDSPFPGVHLRSALDQLQLDYDRLKQAKAILGAEYEDVTLIGRVGAPIIGQLNARLKLRLRVFSEERGMKALGRIEAGEVISLLGFLIDHCGLENFFEYLSRVASCAFIDSRVLFYHYKLDLSERERFLSDLGQWQELNNPWLKTFTRLAMECPIPVILGGHSLISGSLWALCSELDPANDLFYP